MEGSQKTKTILKKLFIYFGCAGSSQVHGLFSSCSELALLFTAVSGVLIVAASLVVVHRF